jgi:hypothetical protein
MPSPALRLRLPRGCGRSEGLYAGGVAAHWVHRDSAAVLACFQARGPQLFSPSYRLSQKRPFASHPSVRQLLLGAPSLRKRRSPVFRRELRLPGILALFTTTPTRVHVCESFPRSRFVPSSGALNPSTVCSASWLAGLFHPAAVSRTDPVQGLILSAQPYCLVDSPFMPPCR